MERYNEDYLNRESNSAEKKPVGTVETKSIKEQKRIQICDKFSNHNQNVTIFETKRGFSDSKGWSVKSKDYHYNGYCFLNHTKIGKNEILKWSFRIPKTRGLTGIGIVIILE